MSQGCPSTEEVIDVVIRVITEVEGEVTRQLGTSTVDIGLDIRPIRTHELLHPRLRSLAEGIETGDLSDVFGEQDLILSEMFLQGFRNREDDLKEAGVDGVELIPPRHGV